MKRMVTAFFVALLGWATVAAGRTVVAAAADSASQPLSAGAVQTNVRSQVDIRVQRAGYKDPIPAVFVPYLIPGDKVLIRGLGDFEPPASGSHAVRFHLNVARFSSGYPRWWYPNSAGVQLYDDTKAGGDSPINETTIPIYTNEGIGTTIIMLMPEDSSVAGGPDRQMEHARAYINNNAADVFHTALITADAGDQRSFIDNLIRGFAAGNIDGSGTGAQTMSAAFQELGADPKKAADCFSKPTQVDKANCLAPLLANSTNANLPSGVTLGKAASSLVTGWLGTASPYLKGLGTIAAFLQRPKVGYDYLPGSLTYSNGMQELVLPQPAIYEPGGGAKSDVLFFTIGQAQEPKMEALPKAVAGEPAICASASDFTLPMYFNRGSVFTHDAALYVRTADNNHAVNIVSVDGETLAPQPLTLDALRGSASIKPPYRVELHARYGFEPLAMRSMVVAQPASGSWLAYAPQSNDIRVGDGVDIALRSPQAACATQITVGIGADGKTYTSPKLVSPDLVVFHVDSIPQPNSDGKVPIQITQPGIVPDVALLSVGQQGAHVQGIRTYLGDSAMLVTGDRVEKISKITIPDLINGKEVPFTLPADGAFLSTAMDCFTTKSPPRVAIGAARAFMTDNSVGGVSLPLSVGSPRAIITGTTLARVAGDPLMPGTRRLSTPESLGYYSSAESFQLRVQSRQTPGNYVVRIRPAYSSGIDGTACGAFDSSAPVGVEVPSFKAPDGTIIVANLKPSALFAGSLSGELQIQIFDPLQNVGSDWWNIAPAHGRAAAVFIQMPSITAIACPQTADVCQWRGMNLEHITDVSSGSSTPLPLQICANAAQSECGESSKYSPFRITIDGAVTVTVPSAVVTH